MQAYNAIIRSNLFIKNNYVDLAHATNSNLAQPFSWSNRQRVSRDSRALRDRFCERNVCLRFRVAHFMAKYNRVFYFTKYHREKEMRKNLL